MKRSYKFRLRATKKQEVALGACLEDTRQLYNAALEERREAWRMGRRPITFSSQSAQLKEIRAEDSERYGRWSFSCERATIRRLDRAFQGFFRRLRAGEEPGYPRFKGRGWWNSIEWQEGHGALWDSVPHPKVTRVYFMVVGHVRVHQHRAIKGQVKTVTAKREGGRWSQLTLVTPPNGAPGAGTSLRGTVSSKRSSDVSPAVTKPTPTSTPPEIF